MPIALGLVVLSYLMGSVPTSYWVGKAVYGIDLRQEGSGNLGATNAFRVLGKGAGFFVFAVDFAKGYVPVLVFLHSNGDPNAAAFGTRIDAVIDGGPAPGGAPSTIVEVVNDRPVLRRSGAIAWDRVLESLQR